MYIPISAKAALLQALLDGSGYGIELAQRIQTRTNGAIVLLQGSLYPALKTLEEEGLVTSFEGDQRGDIERTRTHYKLTEKGTKLARHHRAALIGLTGKRLSREEKAVLEAPPT